MSDVGGLKVCPFCKERIRAEAVKCRFCGEWFDKPAEPTADVRPARDVVGTAQAPPPELPSTAPVTGKGANLSEGASASRSGGEARGMGPMRAGLREHDAEAVAPTAPDGPIGESGGGLLLVGDRLG